MQCRVAPSLGELEDTPENIWGTRNYVSKTESTVFFGLYGLPDFYQLWRHKGYKYILWAGSDINHFINGYWLDEKGEMRISSAELAKWLNHYCENWVENTVEQAALATVGVHSKICPSFLGDVNKFELSYQWSERPKLYTSVSGDNFELYGWNKIPELSELNPDVEFHLYGNTKEYLYPTHNIFIHGKVPKEQMNEEIKDMQGALRLTEFDGASEIIVKAMLMGQYAFSLIPYPYVHKISELNLLKSLKGANLEGRKWWMENLNSYPWNINIQKKQGEG